MNAYIQRGWELPEFTTVCFGPRRADFCVVVFVINEGLRLVEQLARMVPICTNIDVIVADGCSTDGSTANTILSALGVRACLTKLGPGRLGAQMRMAFAWLLEQGYEGCITIDGNGKDDVRAIPQFARCLQDGWSHLQGSRYIPGGRAINTPAVRHYAVRWLHAPAIRRASGFPYTDTTNGFRGYARSFLLDPRVAPFRRVFTGYELHYYLAIRAGELALPSLELPVTRQYPDMGPVPTKISGPRAYLRLLATLYRSCRHRFDPPAEPDPRGIPG